MQLLSAAFEPGRAGPRQPLAAPCLVVATVAIAVAALGLAMDRAVPVGIGRGIATAAVHGAFLTAGWIIASGGRPHSLSPLYRLGSILLAAGVTSHVSRWGGVLYSLLPLFPDREARRHAALRAIGAGVNPAPKALALGVAAGTSLGVHLLISASLTFGYSIRVDDVGAYLAAVAYDVGASALTTEWLFRGAVFSQCWRRWEFWPAAGVSTAVMLGRYLLDPALPTSLEVRAGAVFYLSLLGLA